MYEQQQKFMAIITQQCFKENVVMGSCNSELQMVFDRCIKSIKS